ncbi:MAG: AMP-binding protein [Ferrovibrionaceae bacterium]
MSEPSAYEDTFARDRLPPPAACPVILRTLPEVNYPPRLNCAVELLDKPAAAHGDRPALHDETVTWSYAELREKVDRIAHVLVDDLGVRPGNRVLLRAPNNLMYVACWFAVMKVGAIAVATMPLLRWRELLFMADKAEIKVALCDWRLRDELETTMEKAVMMKTAVYFNGGGDTSLEARMAAKPTRFDAVDTAADDICLIAFTSGTTGNPKGCMHGHQDVLAICDTFSRHVLKPQASDIFAGSPPLAFTFGLGALVTFPFRAGASTLLIEQYNPEKMLKTIQDRKVTVLFTAPTAYRGMTSLARNYDLSSLRRCVSAGETLPRPTWEGWHEATGIKIIDGIGATEMLHIFISAADDDIRPGSTGKPVPGFEARVVDDAGEPVPPGTVGKLAVRGPTGCRYLDNPERQAAYVRDGWNLTGDAYMMDQDGYFWFQARADDMIISAGYNISGPEVETVLMTHPLVAECAVIGAPDQGRGMLVKAFIILKDHAHATPETVKALQDYVKAEIAPYKYPRAIEFVETLPRTQTGKIQRFVLRDQEFAKSAS